MCAVGRALGVREFEWGEGGGGVGRWGVRKLLVELGKGHGHSRFFFFFFL